MQYEYKIIKLNDSALHQMWADWYILANISNDKMYFYRQVIKQSKHSTELVLNKSLIDLIKEEFKPELFEWEKEYLEWIMKEFIIYWTQKNPKGRKEKWEMEKIFDVNKRFYTFVKNDKKFKNNKNTGIWQILD